MEQIIIKGKIEFIDEEIKGYSRKFTATLFDSACFKYGNGTSVEIAWGRLANGVVLNSELIDTRYDTTIKRNETDFKKWIQSYFKTNYRKHVLVIY